MNSMRYPKLYTPGHLNLLFNKVEFLKSVAHGVVSSFVLFFIPYGAFSNSIAPDGVNLDGQQLLGTTVSTILVIVVNAQIALDTSYWTVFNHIVIWGSVAFYLAMTLFINSDIVGNQFLGSLRMTLGSAQFWFVAFLTVAVLLLPVIAFRFFYTDVFPTLSDRVRLKQRRARRLRREGAPESGLGRATSVRQGSRRRSVRSGYAFAHQEGFGRLIMSGKIMRRARSGGNWSNSLHVPPTLPNQPDDTRSPPLA